ncbi:ABC transporter permease [Aneurinibacillus aneurinilyticus]|jgi:ABC-2 type transport system permease protein|uniref:ABC transporter permease subunit n=1 Tax=Aneurinibacillus aneurinilyticus TaxID=1391 RepID=A0A848D393_ANEAE|nr:ABC transporter permease [Aneurinibacillus aneurinilyticus]NMF00171.1 ABC transporter permease subunit [Aneurinibacillus aneurinilyticus]
MRREIGSEWIKYKRSAVPWIIALVPLGICGIIMMYGRGGRGASWTLTQLFDKVGAIWYGALLCFFWGLLPALAAQLEAGSGRWSLLRCRGVRPGRLYISKLLVIVMHTAISTLLLIMLLIISAKLLGVTDSPHLWAGTLAAIAAGWLASLPLLAISLWLAEAFGWPIATGFGFTGIIIAAVIGATSLGNEIWMLLPWTWPVRFSYTVYQLVIDPANSEFSYASVGLRFAAVLLIFAAISALSSYWFGKREVR